MVVTDWGSFEIPIAAGSVLVPGLFRQLRR
jgi:hypothetical protein